MQLKQFFDYLHDVDFPYVVLRNWENLPDSVQEGGHGDLDLLVYDLDHFLEIFPDASRVYPAPRVMYRLDFDGLNTYIDVRSVGDGYYPTEFALEMLNTREYNPKGFFTPDPLHFRLALAYHAVHHKGINTYKRYLGDVEVKDLLKALKRSEIGYVYPNDFSVGRFNPYWKGATSIVSKEGDKVVKKQESYQGYNLIDNEYRILKDVESKHFPRVTKEEFGISLEDCGERLNSGNLPSNWKAQLQVILNDLRKHKIVHRDIKPDNLMVKDGVIKLIDFGWAKFEGEKDNPPSCLGFPYKPSWGWDDLFSMRKVMKELDHKLEEVKV